MSDFKAKCTKFDFTSGSAPDPAGELTAVPQTLQLDLRGPTSKGRGRGERGEGRGKGKGKGWERGGRESVPLALILQLDHWVLHSAGY